MLLRIATRRSAAKRNGCSLRNVSLMLNLRLGIYHTKGRTSGCRPAKNRRPFDNPGAQVYSGIVRGRVRRFGRGFTAKRMYDQSDRTSC